MANQNNLLLNISALYRNTNKYFDRVLAEYEIGSGQMISLLIINEHEGITMQQLSGLAELDKGTITKNVQRLLDVGYITMENDSEDRRVKHLYTTDKSREVISQLYDIRNNCVYRLLDDADPEQAVDLLQKMTVNSRNFDTGEDYKQIRIGGLQKMTLLDFPGKVACTVFTSGCNLKCPFCHNKDLVYIPENYYFYSADDVLAYLEKRSGVLDGVAITGGEPLMQPGIFEFIEKIKEMGFLVKLDTNGLMHDRLRELIDRGCVDYIAMDIKNTFEKYSLTTGQNLSEKQLENIRKSMDLLMEGRVDYEFRTTVAKTFHTKEDLLEMAKMLKGCKRYFLQSFKLSDNIISSDI